ncbi:MAG: cation:proton antiporter [Candidatus Micrarchaeota archaeon]
MLELFTLIGVIIVVGFLASAIFERTRIPDALLLMLLGVIVGPVFHWVDLALFSSAAPFVGTIALIILLFDGGLNLDFFRVVKEFSSATIFTFAGFIITVLAMGAFMAGAFGWPLAHGFLLGAVLGGTSSSIVIGIVSRLRASESAKAVLTLESALTDALCIIAAVSILGIIAHNSVDVPGAVNSLLGAFAIAALAGIAASIAWVYVLRRMASKPYAYMLSLAAIFLLYSFVEAVKASGAIAVLVFGLGVGNARNIAERFALPLEFRLDDTFKAFQTEISFFVRTFFFVYLGTLFNVFALPQEAFVVAGVAMAAILVSRYIGVGLAAHLDPGLKKSKVLMLSMMPRGLAAAVLASYPATEGVIIPFFTQAVLLAIIATNVLTTVGVFVSERSAPASLPPAEPKPEQPAQPQPRYSKAPTQEKPRIIN